MTYLKAIEAGVDIIDTALSPLGNGTSQPATESMVATLAGTEYDTGLDLKKADGSGEIFYQGCGQAESRWIPLILRFWASTSTRFCTKFRVECSQT